MSDSQSTKNQGLNSFQDDTTTTVQKVPTMSRSEHLESKKEEHVHRNSIDTGKEARVTTGADESHHLSSPEGHKHGKRRGSTTVDEEIPPPPPVDKKVERTHNNLVNWAKRFSVVEEELHPLKQQRRLSVDKKVTGDKHRKQSLEEQDKEHQNEHYQINHGKKRLSLWEEAPIPATVTQGQSAQDKQKPKYQRRISLWQEDEETENPNVSTINPTFQKQETLIELKENLSRPSKVKTNTSDLDTTLRTRSEKLQENKNPQKTTIMKGNDETLIFENEGEKVAEKNNGEEKKLTEESTAEEKKLTEESTAEEEKKLTEESTAEEEKLTEEISGEHMVTSKTPFITTPNSDIGNLVIEGEKLLERSTSYEISPVENITTTNVSQTALESNEQEEEPIPAAVASTITEDTNIVLPETEEQVNGKVQHQAKDQAVLELYAEAPEKLSLENNHQVLEENPLKDPENKSEITKNQFTEVEEVIEKGCNTDEKTYSDAECSQDTKISRQTDRNRWNKEKWNVLLDVLSGYENIPCNKCNKTKSDDSVGSIILGTIQDLVEAIAGSSTQEKEGSPPPKSDD